MQRALGLATDARASQYWDANQTIMKPYNDRFHLTGPCAGIFMLFGPEAVWERDGPPVPMHTEDAHAREFNRPLPQFDAERFAEKASELLKH